MSFFGLTVSEEESITGVRQAGVGTGIAAGNQIESREITSSATHTGNRA